LLLENVGIGIGPVGLKIHKSQVPSALPNMLRFLRSGFGNATFENASSTKWEFIILRATTYPWNYSIYHHLK
jgi:hypothetical protein